jgi:hypothetical protein
MKKTVIGTTFALICLSSATARPEPLTFVALTDCTYPFNRPVARRTIYGAAQHLMGGFDHLTLLEVGDESRVRYDAPQPDSVSDHLRATRDVVETNCTGKGSNLAAGLKLASDMASRASGRVAVAFITNGAAQGGKIGQFETAARSLATNNKVSVVLVAGLESREGMDYRATLEKQLGPLMKSGKLLMASFNPKNPALTETDRQLEVFWRRVKR